jgi:hypothetical protein
MKKKNKIPKPVEFCPVCGEPMWSWHAASVHCRTHPKKPAYKEK